MARATIRIRRIPGCVSNFNELWSGFSEPALPGALESKGQRLVFWGDILHVAEVQLPRPEVTIEFDSDSVAAAAQRARVFADAARRGYLVAPAHINFPGVGHLVRDGEGYRWVPLTYVNDAAPPAAGAGE